MDLQATILIVDDEPANVDVLSQELGEEGYTILTACDGEEALIKVQDHQPDLILLAMEERKHKIHINGYIITRKDSGLRRLTDLKGRTFAFGNRTSTAGRYLSQAALVEAGVHAGDFKSFQFHDRHDQVA